MRVLAIDYGKKRIGVAISDPMKILASPLRLVEGQDKLEKTVKHFIASIPEIKDCKEIVIGLPLNMKGEASEMSKEVKEFGSLLENATGKKVNYLDERLSSKGVETYLKEQNLSRKQRSKKLDIGSACLLLQTYLNIHFS